MQAEVVEWVGLSKLQMLFAHLQALLTIKKNVPRDTGIIIDAIAWDLSHGGNVRCKVASSYFYNGGKLY